MTVWTPLARRIEQQITQIARAASAGPWSVRDGYLCDPAGRLVVRHPDGGASDGAVDLPDAAHIAYNDPVTTLGHVRLTRTLLRLHRDAAGDGTCWTCSQRWGTPGEPELRPEPYPCPTLREVAALYGVND